MDGIAPEAWLMRELKDLTVKGMALVKSPANRKRFLMHKSEAPVEGASTTDSIQAAPEEVVKAVRAISLTKGADDHASDALEAIAHLMHGSGLSLSDVSAAAHAAGLANVEKAAPKKADEEDEYEDDEEEMDEGDESDDAEEEAIEDDQDHEPKGKGHPSLPPEINRKVKARKSTQEQNVAEVEKSENREFVSKSEYDAMVERVAKAHERLEQMDREKALSLEKSANQSAYSDLKVDHDALARTTLSLRKSAPEDCKALEATLKAANEQVRVAKASGGSLFRSSSSQPYVDHNVAKRQGDQFKQLVDDYLQKNAGSTRQSAIAAVAKSAEAVNAYKQLETEA